MIILNPTFELSLSNIKERANRIGRDVKKEDAVFVYANIYSALKRLTEKYKDINYIIYNKQTNIPKDLSVSKLVEDLNHGTYEEISNEYDEIMYDVCTKNNAMYTRYSDDQIILFDNDALH